jgi:hypothetical protein
MPMARHCIPQKQTHHIDIIAFSNIAPSNAAFGARLDDMVPSAFIAANSAMTMATNASTSEKASQGQGRVFAEPIFVLIITAARWFFYAPQKWEKISSGEGIAKLAKRGF